MYGLAVAGSLGNSADGSLDLTLPGCRNSNASPLCACFFEASIIAISINRALSCFICNVAVWVAVEWRRRRAKLAISLRAGRWS